ncbi:MAG: hypothetical protein NT138_00300 [Planctomycetales bacterium]|nr:hypothetical protein [Planctomycetales bacterium]
MGGPRSLLMRVLPQRLVERYASRIDQKKVGEAFLGEFVLASDRR